MRKDFFIPPTEGDELLILLIIELWMVVSPPVVSFHHIQMRGEILEFSERISKIFI